MAPCSSRASVRRWPSCGCPAERALGLLCHTLRAAWTAPVDDLLPFDPEQEKARSLSEPSPVCGSTSDARAPGRCTTEPSSTRTGGRRRSTSTAASACTATPTGERAGGSRRAPRCRVRLRPRDPDGFLADPAYDLGVVLRDWSAQLMSRGAMATAREFAGWCPSTPASRHSRSGSGASSSACRPGFRPPVRRGRPRASVPGLGRAARLTAGASQPGPNA